MSKFYDNRFNLEHKSNNDQIEFDYDLSLSVALNKNKSLDVFNPLLIKYEEGLYSSDPHLSKVAAEQLANLGFHSINVLTTALKSDLDHVVINSANGIKQIGPNAKIAVFNLALLLQHKNKVCREASAATLGILKSIPSISVFALASALGDEELTVRQYASAALGEFDGHDLNYVLHDLQNSIYDEDKHVRIFVNYAIAKTGM